MLRHILGNLFLPFSRTHHFPNSPSTKRLIHEGPWWASLCSAKGFQKFDWRPPVQANEGQLLQAQLDVSACRFQSMTWWFTKFLDWIASQLKSKLLKNRTTSFMRLWYGRINLTGTSCQPAPRFCNNLEHQEVDLLKTWGNLEIWKKGENIPGTCIIITCYYSIYANNVRQTVVVAN